MQWHVRRALCSDLDVRSVLVHLHDCAHHLVAKLEVVVVGGDQVLHLCEVWSRVAGRVETARQQRSTQEVQ